jgi:hypothetical protein
MLTSQNNAHRWILATIVKSGNCWFWGWPRLFFVTFFLLLFFLRTWNQNFFFAFARENSPVQPLLQTAKFVSLAASFLAYEHGYPQKYLIPIPMYNHKFVWPYFKQKHLILFPALVFAYELQSPPNVSNTNSCVILGICMTILQTASLWC